MPVLCTCVTLGLSLLIRLTKCTHFNVLIYKTPICFGFQWLIIRECSCTKQSLGHTIISILGNAVRSSMYDL